MGHIITWILVCLLVASFKGSYRLKHVAYHGVQHVHHELVYQERTNGFGTVPRKKVDTQSIFCAATR